MSRLVLAAVLAVFIAMNASAVAQMTVTPGPGGTPIAPGSAVPGFTPGGVGPGGTAVGPGPAARGVPMYRVGPGDTPLAPRPDPYPANPNETVRLHGGCGNTQCLPESLPQGGRLTIDSQDAGTGKPPTPDTPIDSTKELLAALRTCWHPPAPEQAQGRSQMTVRVSFKRNGEIVGQPFVTYTTRGMSADTKKYYLRSIRGAFERCSPLPFSKKFGAAIAGRPISIRYADARTTKAGSRHR